MSPSDKSASRFAESAANAHDEPHIGWIDAMRGLAIILLLILHACNVPNFKVGVQGPEWLDPVNAFFAPFRMPALMFVSGMLLSHSLAKPLGVYFARKLQNLVWPYLVWVVPLLMSAGWAYFETHYLFTPRAWIATGYLWYLFYLICFSAIAPFIRWIPTWLTPLLCLAATIILPPSAKLEDVAYFATYFFAGNAFFNYRRSLLPWLRHIYVVVPLTIGAIGLGIATATISYSLSREVELMPLNLAGVLAFAVLLERVADQRWLTPVSWIGRNAVVYYTVHWPIMLAMSVFLVELGLEFWLTIGLFIAVFAIATPLAAVRHRRPWKWLFEAPGLGRWTSPRRALVSTAVAPSSSVDEPGTMNRQPPRGPHT